MVLPSTHLIIHDWTPSAWSVAAIHGLNYPFRCPVSNHSLYYHELGVQTQVMTELDYERMIARK